jgi:hypothetical protein
MRYKLILAGAAVAGFLLLVQALGVFGAPPRTDRTPTTPIVSVAITPAPRAEKRALQPVPSLVIPDATAEAARLQGRLAATPAASPTISGESAMRRLPVLPTPTVVASGSGARLLNGLPIDMIAVAPDDVKQNVRQIYARGQTLGRNARAFSKVGDSTMLWPLFMVNFDWGHYRLGDFAALQRTIDQFRGSFARESLAVRKGMHSWEQFDPAMADAALCRSGEGPLACELRLNNPSFALIRLGANDSLTPEQFEPAMRRLISTCITAGIVPILGTKPDHYEGPQNTINQMIRRIATEYRIPLWDFDLAAETVPGRGLQPDGLHLMEGGTDDYTLQDSLRFIGPVEDLSALLALDAASQAAR